MTEYATSTKRSFAPVADSQTRLLILGSLPGEASLAASQYYAHPRNQFWTLVGAVLGKDLVSLPYEERLALLLAKGIGLWDVVASARRVGSLDASIRDHRPNPLRDIVGTLPSIKAVAFNGGTSSRIGRQELASLAGLELVDLPSSSPAFTMPLQEKQAKWTALRQWLPIQVTDEKP